MKRIINRLIYAVVTTALVFGFTAQPIGAFAAETPTVVIAGSDFQCSEGNEVGAVVLSSVFKGMKGVESGVSTIDGLLFCGDYDIDLPSTAPDTEEGIEYVHKAVKENFGENYHSVMIKGNHDIVGSKGLAKSGANDHPNGKYGVFAINESDYMWHNSNPELIRATATNLEKYLDEKVKSQFTAPIFVISHLPLHFSIRTVNDGDTAYAEYLYDALYSAAEKGLNIIFLYGHDHSNGWDDYLGGSAVYLQRGDTINIANIPDRKCSARPLNFTYMNAGFTGYYNKENNGADATLTTSMFKIYSDRVEIARYDRFGYHSLKSEGVRNTYKNETDSDYAVNKDVYDSPQILRLNKDIRQADDETGSIQSEQAVTVSSQAQDDVYENTDSAVSSAVSEADTDANVGDSDGSAVIYIIIAVAVVLAGGAVAVFIILKRKKK